MIVTRMLRSLALAAAVAAPAAAASQIDTATFIYLERGMTQSEVLLRAGQPDLVTEPGGTAVRIRPRAFGRAGSSGRARRTVVYAPSVEQWHYLPDSGEQDPFVTVITFRGGLVSEIERTKVFDRSHLPPPAAPAPAPAASAAPPRDEDPEGRSIDRTIDAAERYAATRARLLEARRASEAAARAAGPLTVYRSHREDGSVYYGDRPPPGADVHVVDVE